MGSTSFLGFSYPNLLLVFLNLLFFRNLYLSFSRSKCWDFIWVFFYFIVIFLYHILG